MGANVCVGLSDTFLAEWCSTLTNMLPPALTRGSSDVNYQGETRLVFWELALSGFTLSTGAFTLCASIRILIGDPGEMAATVPGRITCGQGGFVLETTSVSFGASTDPFYQWLGPNYFAPIVTAWAQALASAMSLSVAPPQIVKGTVSPFNFGQVGNTIIGTAAVNGPVPAPLSASPYTGPGFFLGFDATALSAMIGSALAQAVGELTGQDSTSRDAMKAEYKYVAQAADSPAVTIGNSVSAAVELAGAGVGTYWIVIVPTTASGQIVNNAPFNTALQVTASGSELVAAVEQVQPGQIDVSVSANGVPDWMSSWAREEILFNLSQQFFARLQGLNFPVCFLPVINCQPGKLPTTLTPLLQPAGPAGGYYLLEGMLQPAPPARSRQADSQPDLSPLQAM